MRINTQAVNFNADKDLLEYIEKKMNKLETFSDKIISIDVYLKLENTNDKDNKTTEIKVHVPGDEFIVKKTMKSFEEGVDSCEDSLKRMVKRWKEKN